MHRLSWNTDKDFFFFGKKGRDPHDGSQEKCPVDKENTISLRAWQKALDSRQHRTHEVEARSTFDPCFAEEGGGGGVRGVGTSGRQS